MANEDGYVLYSRDRRAEEEDLSGPHTPAPCPLLFGRAGHCLLRSSTLISAASKTTFARKPAGLPGSPILEPRRKPLTAAGSKGRGRRFSRRGQNWPESGQNGPPALPQSRWRISPAQPMIGTWRSIISSARGSGFLPIRRRRAIIWRSRTEWSARRRGPNIRGSPRCAYASSRSRSASTASAFSRNRRSAYAFSDIHCDTCSEREIGSP